MSENKSSMGLCVVALCLAVVALLAGIILPEAQDIAVDLGLDDLNDVNTSGVVGNQTIIWNGSNWVPASFSNQTVTFGWDDLNFPALSLAKSANLAPTQGAIFASGSIEGLLFDGSTQVNEVFGAGEITHSYEEGTNLYPHIHWMATTADTGNVTWFLEYNIGNDNVAYGAPVTVNVTQATTGAAWVHLKTDFPAVNGSGLEIGSQITFHLYRNATTPSDSYTANVALLSFGIHFKMNSIGSTGIGTK